MIHRTKKAGYHANALEKEMKLLTLHPVYLTLGNNRTRKKAYPTSQTTGWQADKRFFLGGAKKSANHWIS